MTAKEESSMLQDFSAATFSHNESGYIPDPFPFYAKMRREQPVFFSENIFGGTWLFFGYADCRALILEERLSNERAAVPLRFLPPDQRAGFGDMLAVFERWLAFHDSTSHTRLRRQANRSYAPFRGERVDTLIQRAVDRLLDSVDHDEFDLMADFAFPLSAIVIADLLGVSSEAHADLTRWTDDIGHLFGSTHVSAEHVYRTQNSTRELMQFLSSRESMTLSEQRAGLMHQMLTTDIHGYRFDEDEVLAQSALLLFAGTASIRYLIGNSVYTVDQRDHSERQLLVDTNTAADAVEELLRFCNPVQFVGRVARHDFTYTCQNGSEAHIRQGQPLLLYIGSANRDSDKFFHADELVLTRPSPNEHLTFGAGRHLCFGDPLVRATTRIALATLYRRIPQLRVDQQELDWNNNLGFHGFQSLSVTAGV
ncbi:cytochrome P450 [Saccharomonospora sp. NPDC046836]|uniref:cytochrome P450 n=1 Tax=Saccharomonospora sp. NPDC046836 TaxID=3156921 RepID=UPI0033FD2DDB